MNGLMLFPSAVRRDPAVETWLREHSDPVGAIAGTWFDAVRACGDDVTELIHDGRPTACVGIAAFAYVDAFTAHANVGLFRGAELEDPESLLHGSGRLMRHVKIALDRDVDEPALKRLIRSAYLDMRRRLVVP